MNYESELKGWALDRAIELKKFNIEHGNNILDKVGDNVFDVADKIVKYAYVPRKDLQDHAAHLGKLFENGEVPLETLEHLQAQLAVVIEQAQFQASTKAKSEAA